MARVIVTADEFLVRRAVKALRLAGYPASLPFEGPLSHEHDFTIALLLPDTVAAFYRERQRRREERNRG